MSKEKRKKELEREIRKLQEKLGSLDGGKEYPDEDEDDYLDEERIRVINSRRSGPAKPMPPMPPMPPAPSRVRRHVQPVKEVHVARLSEKDREKLRKDQAKLKEEKLKMQKEIQRMRESLNEKKREFSDFRKELREKENEIKEREREIRNKRVHSYSYSWDTDLDEDIEVMTDDLELRLGDYTRSILASVAESLKSSMGIAIKGAEGIGGEMKDMGEEIGKIGKEIGDKISKDVYVSVGPTIPEDKLEEFYEIGATIVAAIGDPNRLKILKELERGPKYQKELSDITNLRGGTFKHHMDRLLDEDVKFVTQEVVRGRYLLTTRGREALKLAEMQFRRYLQAKERENIDGKLNKAKLTDSDDEYDVDIK